jgi:arabinose-5-phosphate isomerase
VLRLEAAAIELLSARLDDDFCRAVDLFFHCRGSVIIGGVGKAGLIAQKVAASFASTGTRSHFVHPAEAMHGDLGKIGPTDCLLLLSYSGETEEILRLIPPVLEMRIPLVAMTSQRTSSLARHANITLELGHLAEACNLKLAPSTTTTAMLALGDALAIVLSQMREFTPRDFVRYHPGGSLGRQLTSIAGIMRPLEECRVAASDLSVREVFVALSRPGRRTGAIMLVNSQGQLEGIFTDSDLARLLESGREAAMNGPIREVMTAHPLAIRGGASLQEAWQLLSGKKISELPVLDAAGCPLGLIDITDMLTLAQPRESLARQPQARPRPLLNTEETQDACRILPFPVPEAKAKAVWNEND